MATLLGAGDQENSNQDGRRPRLDAHGFVPFSWSKLQAAECQRKYLLDCLGESHCRVEFRASEVDKTVCCNACNRAMEVTWVPTIQPLVAKEKTPPESTIAGAVLHFVREWAAEEAMRVVHGDDRTILYSTFLGWFRFQLRLRINSHIAFIYSRTNPDLPAVKSQDQGPHSYFEYSQKLT
jgi:hypothetical protein